MSYRLAYGFLVMLLLGLFMLLLGLRMLPYWQHKLSYEPVAVSVDGLTVAWVDNSSGLTPLPLDRRGTIHFSYPSQDQQEVEGCPLKIVVRQKLPDAPGYVVKLRGQEDTITLPLKEQTDGTYSTAEFLPLKEATPARYANGLRVFHVHTGECYLAVEKVVNF